MIQYFRVYRFIGDIDSSLHTHKKSTTFLFWLVYVDFNYLWSIFQKSKTSPAAVLKNWQRNCGDIVRNSHFPFHTDSEFKFFFLINPVHALNVSYKYEISLNSFRWRAMLLFNCLVSSKTKSIRSTHRKSGFQHISANYFHLCSKTLCV